MRMTSRSLSEGAKDAYIEKYSDMSKGIIQCRKWLKLKEWTILDAGFIYLVESS